MAPPVAVLVAAVVLTAVHIFAGRLRILRIIPRSRFLSMAGGISVAYVFVHLLPELAARQTLVTDDAGVTTAMPLVAREQILFVAALAGFALFYGLEQLAHRSRREPGPRTVAGGARTRTTASVFWLHIVTFAAYNALVGYLLVNHEETGVWSLFVFVTAMGLHFVVNDFGLRDHHQDAYEHVARWVLAGAVVAGVTVGILVGVPEDVLSLLFAFLAGGIMLNVIKEELPERRESRFWAFGAGAAAYTVLLLFV